MPSRLDPEGLQTAVTRRASDMWKYAREQGFTLVEVLVAVAIVPLILTVAFSVVSVVLRTYQAIEARASLSSEGARVMETIARDVRGARTIYADSSADRLHGLLQDGVSKMDYVFTRPDDSLPGTLARNGESLFSSAVSVSSCEFSYLEPQSDPDTPPRAVAPDRASSMKARFSLLCEGVSMTYESVFDLRNL